MKINKKIVVACLMFLAIIVAYHQYVNWNIWFDTTDLHHETMIVGLLCFAAGIIVSEKIEGKIFSKKK